MLGSCIDASQRFAKLRKNLGAKNCELKEAHIREILEAHKQVANVERQADDGLAAKVFDNSDFGYYKVTIERPKRLKAQFTAERIAPLRYDKSLLEPMTWAYETYGDRVYTELHKLVKDLEEWCETNQLDLNTKKRKALYALATWQKHKQVLDMANSLHQALGEKEYHDFNAFKTAVDKALKTAGLKPSAGEKKAILDAVSWYDPAAEKVIKKKQKLTGDQLEALLHRLGCTAEELPDHGYYPSGKAGEYTLYETESDLRDYENVPLASAGSATGSIIHDYFLREVKPHVAEAWIDLEKTKIGYEISFNKYFYQHKPLRSLAEITAEILELEKETENMIQEILKG